jgi:hypothetical protein
MGKERFVSGRASHARAEHRKLAHDLAEKTITTRAISLTQPGRE